MGPGRDSFLRGLIPCQAWAQNGSWSYWIAQVPANISWTGKFHCLWNSINIWEDFNYLTVTAVGESVWHCQPAQSCVWDQMCPVMLPAPHKRCFGRLAVRGWCDGALACAHWCLTRISRVWSHSLAQLWLDGASRGVQGQVCPAPPWPRAGLVGGGARRFLEPAPGVWCLWDGQCWTMGEQIPLSCWHCAALPLSSHRVPAQPSAQHCWVCPRVSLAMLGALCWPRVGSWSAEQQEGWLSLSC